MPIIKSMKQPPHKLLLFYTTLRHIALIAIFASCVINAGCASYPPNDAPAVDNSRTFSVPYDTAWQKMLEAVVQEGELLTALDKNSGLISLQRKVTTRDIELYAYDDTGMFWNQAVANVTIRLTPQDERATTITINTKIAATGRDFFDVLFSRTREMTLHSRGYLEKHYLSKFSKIIAALKTSE
jgi:hypothetical protein